jgi:hypothetical protein
MAPRENSSEHNPILQQWLLYENPITEAIVHVSTTTLLDPHMALNITTNTHNSVNKMTSNETKVDARATCEKKRSGIC